MPKGEPDPRPTGRADRLKAALRENLRRRKAQASARRTNREATEKPQIGEGLDDASPPGTD
jgi:hypothetical protein